MKEKFTQIKQAAKTKMKIKVDMIKEGTWSLGLQNKARPNFSTMGQINAEEIGKNLND